MIHSKENNQDTESFLKSNGKKFQGDCLTVMKLLYSGLRLNAQLLVEKYHLHDRRLRNCREARPDIVKSGWVHDANGKRLYVEYWVDVPKPVTKKELQQWWDEFQNEQPISHKKMSIAHQLDLYENQYR